MEVPRNCNEQFFSIVESLDVSQFPQADPLTRLIFHVDQLSLNAVARVMEKEQEPEFVVPMLKLLSLGDSFSTLLRQAAADHRTVSAHSQKNGEPVPFPFAQVTEPPTFARAIGSRILPYKGGLLELRRLDIASHPYHHETAYTFAIRHKCSPDAAINALIQRGGLAYDFLSEGNFMTVNSEPMQVMAFPEHAERIKEILDIPPEA